MRKEVKFSDLIGKIITRIERFDDELHFRTDEGKKYKMYHSQDCCETVSIEDICGELEWLLHSPILLAEERTNSDERKDNSDSSFTWTFYEIATINGSVTIRWYGESNGFYSESVDFIEV